MVKYTQYLTPVVKERYMEKIKLRDGFDPYKIKSWKWHKSGWVTSMKNKSLNKNTVVIGKVIFD